MQILKFDSLHEWLDARKGRITGSRLKDIEPKKNGEKKIEFYKVLSERLLDPSHEEPKDENTMHRGNRLEGKALEIYKEQKNPEIEDNLVLWMRDDNEWMAVSPDAVTKDGLGAVEVKCLNPARHLEVLLTNTIPEEYEYQGRQYFIVNDKLEWIDFCFYEPRLRIADKFFIKRVNRADILAKLEETAVMERDQLAQIDEIAKRLLAK
jgi:hypothetical protein